MLSLKNHKCLVMAAMLASACALILSGCGTTPTTSGKLASKKAGKIKSRKREAVIISTMVRWMKFRII